MSKLTLPSPAEAARKTGLPPRRIGDWFAGRRNPRVVELVPIFEAYPYLRRRGWAVIQLLAERYLARNP
jgi:hypothetical protein